ncbi:MAG: hypothetical protein RL500_1564, partial [Pseudomonadota bacterium]
MHEPSMPQGAGGAPALLQVQG